MKYSILLILILITTTFAYAKKADVKKAAPEKKYTEMELIEKVKIETLKHIDEIKKKSVAELTKELVEKDAELSLKQHKLQVREEQLKITLTELEGKIKGFDSKQKKFIGCVGQHEKRKTERVSRLVKVISGMKPIKAAELLSVQDTDISVKILAELKPDKASKIFNLMEKEISARLQKQYLNMKR